MSFAGDGKSSKPRTRISELFDYCSEFPPVSDFELSVVCFDDLEPDFAVVLVCRCCSFLEFIEVSTRATFRLTVLISPSSFFRVPRAAEDRSFESSLRSSFSRFVRSSSESDVSSCVLSRFISFTLLLFAHRTLSRGPWGASTSLSGTFRRPSLTSGLGTFGLRARSLRSRWRSCTFVS